MASAAQVLANKQNAQHSTGPKTTAGKAASSRNALKYGIFSTKLLPSEDTSGIKILIDRIQHDPCLNHEATATQIRLYAAAQWHFQRLNRALFPLLEFAQDHPFEAIPQMKPLWRLNGRYRRILRTLATDIYDKRKSQKRKNEPNPPTPQSTPQNSSPTPSPRSTMEVSSPADRW